MMSTRTCVPFLSSGSNASGFRLGANCVELGQRVDVFASSVPRIDGDRCRVQTLRVRHRIENSVFKGGEIAHPAPRAERQAEHPVLRSATIEQRIERS